MDGGGEVEKERNANLICQKCNQHISRQCNTFARSALQGFIRNGARFREASVRLLLARQPFHRRVNNSLINVNEFGRLLKRFRHKCRQPCAARLVRLAECTERTVDAPIGELPLVALFRVQNCFQPNVWLQLADRFQIPEQHNVRHEMQHVLLAAAGRQPN